MYIVAHGIKTRIMEEVNEELRVIPELYFLIAKFLSGGPLKETAKTLLKELERVEVLPRRLDWLGAEHAQAYDDLAAQYADMPWSRLAAVCARALRHPPAPSAALQPRLSLLSEALVRARPEHAAHRLDQALVRRVAARERGAPGAGAGAGAAPLPRRLLRGLALQRRTLGHLSAVYCVAVDCSGRYVVTGADDLLVKVWAARDARLLATLRGAAAEITDVCVSRDAALLAAGSVERLVRVWCLATGAPRAVLHAHAGTITSVHWAPPARADVRWLASTSTDGSVAFWTCSPDGQFLSQPVQYVERMRPGVCHMICAAWSAGGGFLAAGSADQHVRVYALGEAGGAPRRVLELAAHSDAVDSLAWAHRGLRFLSGSKDGSAALWTLHATQWRPAMLRCEPLERGAGAGEARLKVTMVCWDRSDALVVTAVSDHTVRVWCARSLAPVRVLRGHRDEAYVLAAHPALAGVFLSAGHDGQLFVWDAAAPRGRDEPLARFHNRIEGQGDGALFDAAWSGAASIAASDSHGHLLLLGLGAGPDLYRELPAELFFHTDYRPLVRDALGGALDEQTQTPPHLMPPPFLVDVEGAPHAPRFQRLVPGREALALEQLVPAADAARSRLDLMIEALAGARSPGGAGEAGARGVWRGEGVRHTQGAWQSGEPAPPSTRPILQPLPRAVCETIERASAELNALEQSWYRREMRRRPVMISTAPEGCAGPRRRPGRRPRAAPPPAPTPAPAPAAWPGSESSRSSDSSPRLSDSSASAPRPAPRRAPAPRRSSADSDSSVSYSEGFSDDTSESSQYSDWEAGAALAPPARARRRPQPARRYSPGALQPRRPAPAPSPASPGAASPAAPAELPEAYRPGEWLTAVSPRKAPYHPQMGDDCLYFRLGHQRYFEAVAEKDLYKLHARDKPWERAHVYECELVKVVGVKYCIKPPRVVCLRLACALPAPGAGAGAGARSITVRYHDMPDVIDFLVLRQQYEAGTRRRWGPGDRFRCMIDDSWWTGVVLESGAPAGGDAAGPRAGEDAGAWAAAAAAQFLALRVRWDNGEVERLSPWDLEPLDAARLPARPGGAVPVLPHELAAALYRAQPHEWPPRGERAAACRAIARHVSQVMSLAAAEPFVAPVDLAAYPSYARVVPYPVDLATLRARCAHLFYRRAAAVQFDARCIASNAERFNEPHSPIVRQARLVTDLLLHIISHWRDVDVVAKYHELAATYQSSDEEPLAAASARRRAGEGAWRAACQGVLRAVLRSGDAEPFRRPVSADQAPDYPAVVARPMDLGVVERRLAAGAPAPPGERYSSAEQFAADMRLVFANSRLYNTNKRSRIYSMTVRLSALFESLWARAAAARAPPRRARRRVRRAAADSASSESEPLAATSRRVHAARADSWDSDAPLDAHRKGKGVGKKSKGSSTSASADPASQPGPSGAARLAESPAGSGAGVLENDVQLTSDEASPAPCARKRRRGDSGAPSSAGSARSRRRVPRVKRTRERLLSHASSSSGGSGSSGGAGAGSARRYESDHSYRPRYSTDDDAPLLQYRERAGPSGAGGARPRGVSLRARRSPRRYNEDSEEDSVAAISKRLLHHHQRQHRQQHSQRRRQLHAAQSVGEAARNNDHNYFNGNAHTSEHAHFSGHADSSGLAHSSGHMGSSGHVDSSGHALSSGHAHSSTRGPQHGHERHESLEHEPRRVPRADLGHEANGEEGGAGPVSISSRGRVRKLTAKARGLLRE